MIRLEKIKKMDSISCEKKKASYPVWEKSREGPNNFASFWGAWETTNLDGGKSPSETYFWRWERGKSKKLQPYLPPLPKKLISQLASGPNRLWVGMGNYKPRLLLSLSCVCGNPSWVQESAKKWLPFLPRLFLGKVTRIYFPFLGWREKRDFFPYLQSWSRRSIGRGLPWRKSQRKIRKGE